ncbi:MAG: hypothetical protein NTY10_00495, partial [Candidatus Omnitrophica bacterium]|nr:hypothetical protein [Candidatus Omnitrophota bacterium]
KIRQPLPKILKSLAATLNHPYENILSAAGYIPTKQAKTGIVEIPLYHGMPHKSSHTGSDKEAKKLYLNYDFVKSKNCFALHIHSTFLEQFGISKNDIAIICPDARLNNNDLILVREKNDYGIRVFSRTKKEPDGKHKIILSPCENGCEIIVYDSGIKDIELVGKIIRVLKMM